MRFLAPFLLVAASFGACAPAEQTPPILGDFDGSVKPPPSTGGGGDSGNTTDGGSGVIAVASVPTGIFLANGFVYFTNYGTGAGDGTVSVVATTGGTVTNLATAQNGPYALTVASNVVFFTLAPVSGTGGAAAVPTTGGSVTPLQQNIVGAFGIAADSTRVYWTIDSGGVLIEAMPIAGAAGTGKQILDIGGDIHPQGLTLAGTDVYVATTGTQATVLHGGSSGAPILTPIDTQVVQTFADVTVSATTVYATLDDSAPNGAILAFPRGAGSPGTIASSLNHPQRLALDGTHLYFTDPAGGNIWVVDLTSNAVTLFANGLDAPFPIAVADALYVGVQTGIVRIAKL